MIQVAPEVIRQMMNSRAQASPRMRPAPDKVAVPLAPTWPPYTVKTVWMALMNPLKFVIALVGRTTRMPSTGTAYSTTLATPERMMANGTSRCGLVISSPALFGSSKPTKLNSSTPTRATKPPAVGE